MDGVATPPSVYFDKGEEKCMIEVDELNKNNEKVKVKKEYNFENEMKKTLEETINEFTKKYQIDN